jgi:hypothetical protein
LLAAAIGLFALWQMVFLIAANVIDLVPRRIDEAPELRMDPLQQIGTFTTIEPLQAVADAIGNVIDFYSEVTGQEQTWPLFAPGFPPHSTFGAIEVKFSDGTNTTILSDYEPRDYNRAPYRLPFFNVRRYNVEYQFVPAVMQHTEEAIQAQPEEVRAITFMSYRTNQPTLTRWLKWRIGEWEKENPGHGPPVEIIYKARYIPTPLPSEAKTWSKPVRERPLARWQHPDRPPPVGELPLQVYDVSAKRWVTLLTDGGER